MFKKRNHIVEEAKGSIPYWVIAERLGVHENTVQNWMKKEMSKERKEKVMYAISEIKEEIRKEGDM
jgi:transposase-like protein